jgi:tetratricopeptide (TPR) repeat protein
LRRLFLNMWAQVPNWKGYDPMWIGKPEPPWVPPPRQKGQPRPKRPPPHDPEALDWLTALDGLDLAQPDLALPPETVAKLPSPPPRRDAPEPPPPPPPPTGPELETARGEALEVVALTRGIARSQRLDAVEPIFDMAFQLDGVFRDECGRQIRSMESYAVPALIQLMHRHGPAALHLGKQRRYASYQLDRMDRARPMKAIAMAADDRVRAAIVHAYGQERALDAVEAILNQVDATSHRVRREARWAWLRYVTGPPPPPAPKRKRKLPGGREEDEEKPDYLTYREIALLAVQKQLAAILDAPPDPKASAAQLTDQLFAYYDGRHAAEWDAQFAAAQQKEQSGDLKAATDEYGWILAHDPNYPRRGEMAHAFARYGEQLRARGQIAAALGYLRQAVDLAPDGPEAGFAGARVAYLDGMQALAAGVAEPALFRRALALDRGLGEAQAGLARAETLRARRRWLVGGELAAASFAIAFALWALWRRALS